MSDRILFILTYFSTLGSGLVAGLFFIFSACVMTALSKIPSEQGINAMQSINSTILNPLFMLVFMGTALVSVVLAIISFMKWGDSGAIYLLAGSLFYLIGFLVTVAFNVPLNGSLATVDPKSASGANFWTHYLNVWTSWNHVRTLASIASLASFILALRQMK
ncbi:anthrone oxygenase family protein [Paenibacillus sp. KN14-4R]|uniref:anthrone oxygenase family protein n=1 Tax=Paenibacillus sp. KN14-4R TaxID=3445773 RepID=UPI003F9FEF1A